MIRYILYRIFNILLVRYACKWIQTRDSIQERCEILTTFQWSGPDHWDVGLRRTNFKSPFSHLFKYFTPTVTYLNLSCSQTSNGLVRQGWELLYYSHGEMEQVVTSSQGEVAFVTEFNGKKCLLKVSHRSRNKPG
jgi:hypothetical protein